MSPKGKSQEEKRGTLLPAPNLVGCRISLRRHRDSPARTQGLRSFQTSLDCAFFMALPETGEWTWKKGSTGGRKAEALTHRFGVFLGSLMDAKESRARLYCLMGRTETLRRDSWEIGLRFHGWGGGRGLQGLMHQSQGSGLEKPGSGVES